MKLECVGGEYRVMWVGNPKKAHDAHMWCNEQFEPGWGKFGSSGTTDSGLGIHVAVFKRLYHAQWFIIRWSN